ncbi:DUF5684 domain-containing protein [bacterium]|nr:DUF5684 domain-containing protein [bacterium]
MIGGILASAIGFSIAFLIIAGFWRVFEKAGRPGWAVLIPIYSTYTLLKVAKRSGWWLLLFLVPVVNLITWIILNQDIAKRFGKRGAFGLGLAFLPMVFYPILGLGDSRIVEEKTTHMPDADEYEDLSDEREYDIVVEEWPIQRDEI